MFIVTWTEVALLRLLLFRLEARSMGLEYDSWTGGAARAARSMLLHRQLDQSMLFGTEFVLLDSLCNCVSSVIVADLLEPRILFRLLDYINEVVSIDFREEDRVAFNQDFFAVFRFLFALWLDLI